MTVSTIPVQGVGAGSTPSAALHALKVRPIPILLAKRFVVRHHYLHSLPGGTCLAFGVFSDARLLGAVTFGVGPAQVFRLIQDASADDCLTLTRLWLSDQLPRNSESHCLGVVLRALKRHTGLRFLVTYADPSHGHIGTIYQATGWLYTGLSEAMPFYDLGDGKPRHSRSLSHAYGTHSVAHFRQHGITVRLVSQAPKYRYIYFLDPSCHSRLRSPVLPHPKREDSHADP